MRVFPPEPEIENFRKDMQECMHEMAVAHKQTKGMVAVFGSSRCKPTDKNYQIAQETCFELGKAGYGIITGGGPGIMEAANKGAIEAKAPSVGVQPKFLSEKEQAMEIEGKTQYYVYSMHSRKVSISANSSAMLYFPGGLGTMDELFENLTLSQIGKMKGVQHILVGSIDYWKSLLKWLEEQPLRRKYLSHSDFGLIKLAESPKQVAELVKQSQAKKVLHSAQQLAEWFAEDLKKCSQQLGMVFHPSVSIFGSSKIKSADRIYGAAKNLVSKLAQMGFAIYSGGGSGIMEAAAKGALEAGKKAYGLIPFFFFEREKPNPHECNHIQLNMMASRKLVLGSSDALIFYPGGYGTLDEMFEFAVRQQIGDMRQVPIVAFESRFWGGLYSWLERYPVEMSLMPKESLDLIKIVNSPKKAVEIILSWEESGGEQSRKE
ncbi:MAG: TIGR00730 family Rossman fold protein [Candidatus Micrarchaeota archaeon]|nr:TIGR00730 family Rossman fold protein [Candidatus Micrarchaeota archaeon]